MASYMDMVRAREAYSAARKAYQSSADATLHARMVAKVERAFTKRVDATSARIDGHGESGRMTPRLGPIKALISQGAECFGSWRGQLIPVPSWLAIESLPGGGYDTPVPGARIDVSSVIKIYF